MAVGDVYRIGVHQRMHGINYMNVFHFEQKTTSTADLDELLDVIRDEVLPSWAACLSDEAEFLCIEGARILPEAGSTKFLALSPAIPGTIVMPAMPANKVVVVTSYTNEATKAGRGRIYITGIPKDHETRNHIDSTVGALIATFNTVMASVVEASVPNGSYEYGVLQKGPPKVWKNVIVLRTNTPIRVLRSRTPRICGAT